MTRSATRAALGLTFGAALCIAAPSVASAADGDYPAPTPTVSATTVQVVPRHGSPSTAQAPSSLAFTGSNVLFMVAAGTGLAAAGAGLVVAGRRRPRHA